MNVDWMKRNRSGRIGFMCYVAWASLDAGAAGLDGGKKTDRDWIDANSNKGDPAFGCRLELC